MKKPRLPTAEEVEIIRLMAAESEAFRPHIKIPMGSVAGRLPAKDRARLFELMAAMIVNQAREIARLNQAMTIPQLWEKCVHCGEPVRIDENVLHELGVSAHAICQMRPGSPEYVKDS